MKSRLQLDVRNLSLGRRHLVNAYEIKAGIGVIVGITVWSMPKRLRGFTTRRFINPLYPYLYLKQTQPQIIGPNPNLPILYLTLPNPSSTQGSDMIHRPTIVTTRRYINPLYLTLPEKVIFNNIITVWTVVQTVLTATFNSYGNRQISTPYKINTPVPIEKKIGTVDYVREGDPLCQIWYKSTNWGLLGKWVKYNKNYSYLFIPFFLRLAYMSDRLMDF